MIVYGNISDETAAIYVNGMAGVNNGDGTWMATNVPVSASGMASFDVSAIPTGGGDPDYNTNVEKTAEIIMVDYQETKTTKAQGSTWWWNDTLIEKYSAQPYAGADGHWLQPYQAQADYLESGNMESAYSEEYLLNWSPTNDSEVYTAGGTTIYDGPIVDGTPWIPDQDQTWGCASCGPGYEAAFMTHYFANNVHWHYDLGSYTEDLAVTAKTQLKLYTSGKAGINHLNLFCINAGATSYGRPPTEDGDDYPWWSTPSPTVNPSQLQALGKQVGADGNLWVALPDGASPDLNLWLPMFQHYNATATVQKYEPRISARGNGVNYDDLSVTNPEYCVGQNLTFLH